MFDDIPFSSESSQAQGSTYTGAHAWLFCLVLIPPLLSAISSFAQCWSLFFVQCWSLFFAQCWSLFFAQCWSLFIAQCWPLFCSVLIPLLCSVLIPLLLSADPSFLLSADPFFLLSANPLWRILQVWGLICTVAVLSLGFISSGAVLQARCLE